MNSNVKAFVRVELGDPELDADWQTRRFRVWLEFNNDIWSRCRDQFVFATLAQAEQRIDDLGLARRPNIL